MKDSAVRPVSSPEHEPRSRRRRTEEQPELLLQRLIQPQQMQIGRPDHPVAQRTAADVDVCARQRCSKRYKEMPSTRLLASTSARVDGVATLPGKGCAGIGAITIGVCSAVRSQWRRAMFEPHMLAASPLSICSCSAWQFSRHSVHSVPAAWAGLLVFGKVMLDARRGRSSGSGLRPASSAPACPRPCCVYYEPLRHHQFSCGGGGGRGGGGGGPGWGGGGGGGACSASLKIRSVSFSLRGA